MEVSQSSNINGIKHYNKHIKRTRVGKTKVKVISPSKIAINMTLLVLFTLTVFGFLNFDYKDLNLLDAVKATAINIKTMFFEARNSHFTMADAIYQVLITTGLAFLTTLLGAMIAIILGLFAAKNLSNERISNAIKGFVAFIRAVPTILWVLIFAVSAGLGSIAAVIGLTFHTVGYLIKAYSESFEEIDNGVIEALKASGANWWQIVFQAVLPSTATYLLAWTFIRFEINFTNAVAMGAAAGAGGIGFELFMASGFYFDIREVGFIAYLILIFAIILEASSARVKNKYLC